MKKAIFFIVIWLFIQNNGQSQNIAKNNNFWLMEITKIQLSSRWGLENELHLRIANWETKQQILIRPSVFYLLNDQVKFHLGYTHIETYPYGEQPIPIRTPENNLWGQVTLDHVAGSLHFSHRYRMEQRWTGKAITNGADSELDGFIHKNRFRYRLTIKKSLTNKGLYAVIFDEIWLNFGENTALNRLDQNWFYMGLGQSISDGIKIEMAYLGQNIRKSNGLQAEWNNTLQLSTFYAFNKKTN